MAEGHIPGQGFEQRKKNIATGLEISNGGVATNTIPIESSQNLQKELDALRLEIDHQAPPAVPAAGLEAQRESTLAAQELQRMHALDKAGFLKVPSLGLEHAKRILEGGVFV